MGVMGVSSFAAINQMTDFINKKISDYLRAFHPSVVTFFHQYRDRTQHLSRTLFPLDDEDDDNAYLIKAAPSLHKVMFSLTYHMLVFLK